MVLEHDVQQNLGKHTSDPYTSNVTCRTDVQKTVNIEVSSGRRCRSEVLNLGLGARLGSVWFASSPFRVSENKFPQFHNWQLEDFKDLAWLPRSKVDLLDTTAAGDALIEAYAVKMACHGTSLDIENAIRWTNEIASRAEQ